MTPLGYAALKLAARGLRVFPIFARTKNPAIKDNLRLATVDDTIIRKWWNTIDWNIGIATGPGSGVWVLDPDGPEHEGWIRAREAEHGPLPPTVEAITGNGRHLYFKWPIGSIIRNVQEHDYLPDVRGDGGYVLAPPSIHPSGRRYAWSVDSASAFADAPEWLIAAVAKGRTASGTVAALPPEVMRTFVDNDHDGSHRGYAISRLAGYLLRHYADALIVLSLCQMFNETRCVEPLDPGEVTAIVNRIARNEAQRREQSRVAAEGASSP
jgi:hypothetical protein